MSLKPGTKVRVSREATHAVRRACKAVKKTFLLGKTVGELDPCCGCYVVQFNRNIGTTESFYTTGKVGHLDEVNPEYITALEPTKGRAAAAKTWEPKEGDYVRYIGKADQGPAKRGAIGRVRAIEETDLAVGVEFILDYAQGKGHDLSGRVKNSSGWWLVAANLEPVAPGTVFKVGDYVEVTERHDAATPRLKGFVYHIQSHASFQPYGVRFPGWKGGHSLMGRLKGVREQTGHWIPADKLRLIARGEEAEPAFQEPKAKRISKPTPVKDAFVESGYRVRLLSDARSADGTRHLDEGTAWAASKVIIHGGTFFSIPFSNEDVVVVPEKAVEVL